MTYSPPLTDAEKLESVRNDLREWRGLAYNAAQIRDAAGFGRIDRNITRLERIEIALIRRIERAA